MCTIYAVNTEQKTIKSNFELVRVVIQVKRPNFPSSADMDCKRLCLVGCLKQSKVRVPVGGSSKNIQNTKGDFVKDGDGLRSSIFWGLLAYTARVNV